MIMKRNKPGTRTPYSVDVVNAAGNLDYIKSGKLYKNSTVHSVLVASQSDLAGLTDRYEAGTIAYTAGFGSMWQLSAEGTWEEV